MISCLKHFAEEHTDFQWKQTVKDRAGPSASAAEGSKPVFVDGTNENQAQESQGKAFKTGTNSSECTFYESCTTNNISASNMVYSPHSHSDQDAPLKMGYLIPAKYTDHAFNSHLSGPPTKMRKAHGGVTKLFPERLHQMLEDAEDGNFANVVSWQPHGRAFLVHAKKAFVSQILPRYFKQSKFSSFCRQLALYGYARILGGADKGAYYHELFLRGMPELSMGIRRLPKDSEVRQFTPLHLEVNFYSMPAVGLSGSPPVPAASKIEATLPATTLEFNKQQRQQNITGPTNDNDLIPSNAALNQQTGMRGSITDEIYGLSLPIDNHSLLRIPSQRSSSSDNKKKRLSALEMLDLWFTASDMGPGTPIPKEAPASYLPSAMEILEGIPETNW